MTGGERSPVLDACDFYHSMELPGLGEVQGAWDLRHCVDEYLGRLDYRGRRVLEFGPASGYLTFEMERRGADVVAVELDHDRWHWDVVPVDGAVTLDPARLEHLARLARSFELAHERLQSSATLVRASVYDVPEALGTFDVVMWGSVLLHVRDPLRALAEGATRARERLVVTELSPALGWPWHTRAGRAFLEVATRHGPSSLRFAPGPDHDTWWRIWPRFVVSAMSTFGFELESLRFHAPRRFGAPVAVYTVVGRRRGVPDR